MLSLVEAPQNINTRATNVGRSYKVLNMFFPPHTYYLLHVLTHNRFISYFAVFCLEGVMEKQKGLRHENGTGFYCFSVMHTISC